MMELNNGHGDESPRIVTCRFGYGEGCQRIEAVASVCGNDMVVIVGGGSRYHIGAVALAVPRASLGDPAKVSASASVLCVVGHKDDELARSYALKIASVFNCTVSVNVGIHIDQANDEDITTLIHNSDNVINQLIDCAKRGC
jgi:hypothetical protein